MTRRVSATLALLLGAAAIVLAVIVAVGDLPGGLVVVVAALLAAWLAWTGLVRTHLARRIALGLALLLLAGDLVLVLSRGRILEHVAVLVLALLSVAAARVAFAVHTALPRAPRPEHPVLFWNGKSGGGKATRFRLPEAADDRGIEAVEL